MIRIALSDVIKTLESKHDVSPNEITKALELLHKITLKIVYIRKPEPLEARRYG